MKPKTLLAWLLAGAGAVAFLIWALPQVTPYEPDSWTVSRNDAEATSLELARDLGELPADAFVIVNRTTDELLQLRLDEHLDAGGSLATLRSSRLFRSLKYWSVAVHDPKEIGTDWAYRAAVSPTGRLLRVERYMKEETEAAALDAATARQRADRLLDDVGFDRARFGEPQMQQRDRRNRTDLTLRYVDSERLLGERFSYGVEVKFGGDQLLGFSHFFDDPDQDDLASRIQSVGLWQFAWIYLALLLAPLVAIPFIRRYHAGEVGVRRGLQISAVILVAGTVAVLFTAKGISANFGMGALSKPATAVAVVFLYSVTFYLPMALVGFLGWSVESPFSARAGATSWRDSMPSSAASGATRPSPAPPCAA